MGKQELPSFLDLVLIFVGKVCIFLGLVGWLRHMTGSWYYGIFKGLRAVNGWSGPPCLTSPTRAVPSEWQLRPWGQEMTTDDLWGTAVTRKSWSPKPRQTETDRDRPPGIESFQSHLHRKRFIARAQFASARHMFSTWDPGANWSQKSLDLLQWGFESNSMCWIDSLILLTQLTTANFKYCGHVMVGSVATRMAFTAGFVSQSWGSTWIWGVILVDPRMTWYRFTTEINIRKRNADPISGCWSFQFGEANSHIC